MHLSELKRGMIIGAWLMCHNIRKVSRTLKLSISTVHLWIKRFKQSNSVVVNCQPGRPKKSKQGGHTRY